MSQTQLILYFAILALWVLLAEGIYPFLEDTRLRHELHEAGWIVIILLLLGSLFTAPSFSLWLEYAAITFIVYIIAHAFNLWAQSAPGYVPDADVG